MCRVQSCALVFPRKIPRESFFSHETPRSKLLDVFRVSYVTHAIQCLAAMLSVKPIVNRFYYIPGQIREFVRLSIGHWCATVEVSYRGFANERANEAIFVQKWHVSRGETTGRWKIRYGGNAAQTGSPPPHMYRVPQPLTNIFKPRANQVSDQVHQIRDRSSVLPFFSL